ncbi:prepilin peptidase [uncultured Amnibacterium sp.]|uniref:prepilin peptidase n=1 Tax=uncultured Amnibacterium sp. TaxID=1631851 RepID=UPI0035CC6851
MNPLSMCFAGGTGLAIGSFLNVVAYRVPLGRSLSYPPSACPTCGARIRARDNVPVLSWLLLRGRCRNCASAISARYPVVEAATAVFFVLVVLVFGPAVVAAHTPPAAIGAALALVAYLYLAAISCALTLIDLDVHRLPDRIVLPAYGVGAVLLGASALMRGQLGNLLGAAVGLAALGLLYLLLAFVKPGAMGMGDVKLAGVLGLFLGWLGLPQLAIGAFAGFLLGAVFGVLLLLTRRATRASAIPFGPWMLAGAWIGIFFGQAIWSAYIGVFGLA